MIISHKPVQSIAQVIMKWRISILLALVALNLHSAAQKDDNRMPPGTPNQNTETMNSDIITTLYILVSVYVLALPTIHIR